MDGRRFDEFARVVATGASRRGLIKAALGGAVAALAGALWPRRPASGQRSCRQDSDCPSGACCNGVCVNPLSDPDHCGGCNAPCPAGPSMICCDGLCADAATSRRHCGGCDSPCDDGVCLGGACCPTAATCFGACCAGGEVCLDVTETPEVLAATPGASTDPRYTCCPVRQVCGNVCCANGEECVSTTPTPRCCRSGAVCVVAGDPVRLECCGGGTVCTPGVGCVRTERTCIPRRRGAGNFRRVPALLQDEGDRCPADLDCCESGDVCQPATGECCPADLVCGDDCCAASQCVAGTCVPPADAGVARTCAGNDDCPEDQFCIDQHCCEAFQLCIAPGLNTPPLCCNVEEVCVARQLAASCCPAANYCVTAGQPDCCNGPGLCTALGCCPGERLCVTGETRACCDVDEVCAFDGCCPAERGCELGDARVCCDPGATCTDSGCCQPEQICPLGERSVCCEGPTDVCIRGEGCCPPERVCQPIGNQNPAALLCCRPGQLCDARIGAAGCCDPGSACTTDNDCCQPTETCVDGQCQAGAIGGGGDESDSIEETPEIAASLLDLSAFIPLPSEIGPEFGITGGTALLTPEGLTQLGYDAGLINAIAPEFRGGYQVFFTTPPGADGTPEITHSFLGIGFASAPAALAGVETFFANRPATAIDITRGDEGDRGYTIQFPFIPDDPAVGPGIIFESGGYSAEAARVIISRTLFSGPLAGDAEAARRDELFGVWASTSRRRLTLRRPAEERPPGTDLIFGSFVQVSKRPLVLNNEVLVLPGESAEQVNLRATEFTGAQSAVGLNYLFGGDRYRLGNRIVVYPTPEAGQTAITTYPDYFADLIASQGLTGERFDLPITFGDQTAFYRFVIATDQGVIPGLTMAGLFTDLPAVAPPALLVTVSLRDQQAVPADAAAEIQTSQDVLAATLGRIAGPYDNLIRLFPYGDEPQNFVLNLDPLLGPAPDPGLGPVPGVRPECPENVIIQTGPDQCETSVRYTIRGVGAINLICDPASDSLFPIGTTTVTCEDPGFPVAPGREQDRFCTFEVTIEDTQEPNIVCPSDRTEQAVAGTCEVEVAFAPVVQDNCPGVDSACSPASGSAFPVGTTEVVCTAQDRGGNVVSCRFTVTVDGAATCAEGGGATEQEEPGEEPDDEESDDEEPDDEEPGDEEVGAGEPAGDGTPDFAYNSALGGVLGDNYGYLEAIAGTLPQLEAAGFTDLAILTVAGAEIERASVVRLARPVTPGLTSTASIGIGAGIEIVSLQAPTEQAIDVALPILQQFPTFGQIVEGSDVGIPDDVAVTYGALPGGVAASALSQQAATAVLITFFNTEGGQADINDTRRLTGEWWQRQRDVTERGLATPAQRVARLDTAAEEAYLVIDGQYIAPLDQTVVASDILRPGLPVGLSYMEALRANNDLLPVDSFYVRSQNAGEELTLDSTVTTFANAGGAEAFLAALPEMITSVAQAQGLPVEIATTEAGDVAWFAVDTNGRPFGALARQEERSVVTATVGFVSGLTVIDDPNCRGAIVSTIEVLFDQTDDPVPSDLFAGVGICSGR